MSLDILIKRAIKRMEIIDNLDEYLKRIKRVVYGIDGEAEIYLFGSAAEGKHTYSSDIDILIITSSKPAIIHRELWKAGIGEPFEIHIHPPDKLELYKRRGKLIKI